MESYDFKGKTVIPFATSGGSSIKKACEDLKAAFLHVNWKEGKLLNRTSSHDWRRCFDRRPFLWWLMCARFCNRFIDFFSSS